MLLLVALALSVAAPPTIAEAAVGALEAQRAAWNRGDLESSLAAYCDTPEITWVNRSGVSRGFDEFAAAMRQEFADPVRMGRMELEVLDARQAGADGALVTLRWSISRGDERIMGGVSTQLWQPCRGRLRIVFEHAS
jgi:uncharacterized protein (TIGR02246 family)